MGIGDTAILSVVARFNRMFHTLTQTPEEARNENLRRWIATLGGVTPLSEVQPRQRCKVAGVIQNIRIDPREGSGSIEATFIDGTGEMVAKWLGRRSMSGIRLGMGIVAEGVVGEADGELVILNPDYRLVPGPEHG
jgi:hypothetical protein